MILQACCCSYCCPPDTCCCWGCCCFETALTPLAVALSVLGREILAQLALAKLGRDNRVEVCIVPALLWVNYIRIIHRQFTFTFGSANHLHQNVETSLSPRDSRWFHRGFGHACLTFGPCMSLFTSTVCHSVELSCRAPQQVLAHVRRCIALPTQSTVKLYRTTAISIPTSIMADTLIDANNTQ
jgi:hypothetical protein